MKNNTKFTLKDIATMLAAAFVGTTVPGYFPSSWRFVVQFAVVFLLVSLFYNRLSSYREYLAMMIEQHNQQSEDQRRMLHTQRAVLELSNSMIQVSGFEELLNVILTKAIEVIPEAEYGSILMMNDENELEYKALVGFDDSLYDIRFKPEESYQWQATGGHFREPVIIEDLLDYTEEFVNEDTYSSMKDADALTMKSTLSAPILIDGKFFGSINIDSEEKEVFGQRDAGIMAYFANQASIAIGNHQLYDKMSYLSKYDGLTGALNRYSFEETIEGMLNVALAESKKISLALLDMNDFKSVNDNYGHEAGDKVLKLFSEMFRSKIDEDDIFSRFGGDEFVVAFIGKNYDEASEKMHEILEFIEMSPLVIKDADAAVKCGFSFGVAECPVDGTNLKGLVRLADDRMYKHKRGDKI